MVTIDGVLCIVHQSHFLHLKIVSLDQILGEVTNY